jgi:hypothetical protein
MKIRRNTFHVQESKLEETNWKHTMNFESVQSFKYLGSIVNQRNTIEEEE